MPQVELTQQDIQNLLTIINSTQIKGESAETIVLLKRKLQTAATTKGESDAGEDS